MIVAQKLALDWFAANDRHRQSTVEAQRSTRPDVQSLG